MTLSNAVNGKQVAAAFQVVAAVSEAIRELGEVPAGVLYGHIMGKLDAEAFERTIRLIEGAGLITRRGDMLVWTGPGKGGF